MLAAADADADAPLLLLLFLLYELSASGFSTKLPACSFHLPTMPIDDASMNGNGSGEGERSSAVDEDHDDAASLLFSAFGGSGGAALVEYDDSVMPEIALRAVDDLVVEVSSCSLIASSSASKASAEAAISDKPPPFTNTSPPFPDTSLSAASSHIRSESSPAHNEVIVSLSFANDELAP